MSEPKRRYLQHIKQRGNKTDVYYTIDRSRDLYVVQGVPDNILVCMLRSDYDYFLNRRPKIDGIDASRPVYESEFRDLLKYASG